jgi:hypothetical protein
MMKTAQLTSGNCREITTNGLLDITSGISTNNYYKATQEVNTKYDYHYVEAGAIS